MIQLPKHIGTNNGDPEHTSLDGEHWNFFFTVFTPTYNRARTLHRVYNSLSAQTYRDFEWLVIDDGSTDNTSQLIQEWMEKADFPIRYYFQENQGKHIAWNRAADLARGEYFLCADSDDAFVPHALERFAEALNTISDEERDRFYGVVALCMDPSGQVIGDKFPPETHSTDFVELHLFKYESKVKNGTAAKRQSTEQYDLTKLFAAACCRKARFG
jgi:glycosyltransferase involved in cell wall biosynthesis